MKKLLILAYDFPPYVSVGGLRPWSWYKYLKNYGIHPVVVTRQWGNRYGNHLDYVAPGSSGKVEIEETGYGTIIRTPYKSNLANRLMLKYGENRFVLFRRVVSAWYEFMQFISLIGPKVQLYFAARDYLRTNKVAAIIATGDPFILFRYGSKLSLEFNIPWIADYRDPWVHDLSHRNAFKTFWNAFFERRYVNSASSIVTVSHLCMKLIESNIKGKTFHILPNGFDDEAVDICNETAREKEYLTIAFAGTIYNWHPWEKFLLKLGEFLADNPDAKIRVSFYGINNGKNVISFIKEVVPNICGNVFISNKLPNKDLLVQMAGANVLLLFNDYSIMGTKIYDYLAIGRCILFCFNNDKDVLLLKEKHYHIEEIPGISSNLQKELIEKTRSGIIVEDSGHLSKVLADLWDEFKTKGYIACNPIGVEQYARSRQVEKLAEIVKGLGD